MGNLKWITYSLRSGERCYFTFDEEISCFMVGICGFNLEYTHEEQSIQQIGMVLKAIRYDARTILVTAETDPNTPSSSHKSSSLVFATVVAWTGPPASTVWLDSADRLCHNPFGFTMKENVLQTTACLSGWKLGYREGSHKLNKIQAGVESSSDEKNIKVSGFSEMKDASEHIGTCHSLNAGVLAILSNSSEFAVQRCSVDASSTDFGTNHNTLTARFDFTPKYAIALLASFDVEYGVTDHKVKRFAAGNILDDHDNFTHNAYSINGHEVVFPVTLTLHDFHNKRSSINNLTFLVIASQ